jgi:type III pantothenate kinase
VIISCVVPPLLRPLTEMTERYLGARLRVVGPGIRTQMPILYENPREVGADRIVNAVAGYEKHRRGLLICDFGTATTVDAVTPQGEYLGGVIAPGIGISAEALFQRASKLPRVEITRPPRVVGRNTVESMQSGLLYGYVGLVKEIVGRMRAELPFEVLVMATGGLATLIAQETDCIDEIDPHLTLEGLRLLWERNEP